MNIGVAKWFHIGGESSNSEIMILVQPIKNQHYIRCLKLSESCNSGCLQYPKQYLTLARIFPAKLSTIHEECYESVFCLQIGVVREPSSGTALAPAVIAIIVILVIILVGGVVAAIVLAVVIKKRKDKSLR